MLDQLHLYQNQCPGDLTTEEIKSYLFYCREKRGLSNSYINQTISALKILRKDVLGLSWDEGIKIKRPRRQSILPDILSRKEVLAMIDNTSNPKHKAILAVLYSSGIRMEELLGLRLKDIDSERMVMRIVHGKGGKSRDVLLSPRTLELLRHYYRLIWRKPSVYVFEGFKQGRPYTTTSVRQIVKVAVARAGIKKHIYPHSLRHAFATHMLEDGANLKVIQQLLGHSSLRSTMFYLHVAGIDATVKSPFDSL